MKEEIKIMKEEIKRKYQNLAKKYNLPSFDSLNNEFEIITIEEEDFLLRAIRKKIIEKINSYIELFEGVLYPSESELNKMYECGVFSEEEKNEIFNLYKKMMFLNRLSIESSISEDDKKSSEFIKEAWKQWAKIKEELIKHVKVLKESWLKEIKIKTELGYLG